MSSLTEARSPALDVEQIRQDFPILRRLARGKPLVYLDNAATTQKPRRVLDALARYYADGNANIHRGVYALSEEATEAYNTARKTVQSFLNARACREIIFTRNATESINLVAQSFGRQNIGSGDEIVITHMEHHSNIVPWQLLCEQTHARLRVAPIDDRGQLVMDEFERLITARTKLVAVVHVSNSLGTINPVEAIVEIAHRRDVPVLIDGSQAVYHMPVDVQALGCDFYVCTGHKLYGPTGIGVLYGREALLEAMPPYQGGGDMIRSVTFAKTTYADLPNKFEAGTPHIAGVVDWEPRSITSPASASIGSWRMSPTCWRMAPLRSPRCPGCGSSARPTARRASCRSCSRVSTRTMLALSSTPRVWRFGPGITARNP